MHPSLGAEVTVGILPINLDGGALNASYITIGFFQNFGFVAFAFTVLEVLAKQHARPITGLGSAGTRLNVNKTIAGIHLIVKHATKLEVCNSFTVTIGVHFNRRNPIKLKYFLLQAIQLFMAKKFLIRLNQLYLYTAITTFSRLTHLNFGTVDHLIPL